MSKEDIIIDGKVAATKETYENVNKSVVFLQVAEGAIYSENILKLIKKAAYDIHDKTGALVVIIPSNMHMRAMCMPRTEGIDFVNKQIALLTDVKRKLENTDDSTY